MLPLMEHILDVSQQIGIRLNPVNVLPGKEERVANLHLLSRSIREPPPLGNGLSCSRISYGLLCSRTQVIKRVGMCVYA